MTTHLGRQVNLVSYFRHIRHFVSHLVGHVSVDRPKGQDQPISFGDLFLHSDLFIASEWP